MALLIIRASIERVVFNQFPVDSYILWVCGDELAICLAGFFKLYQKLPETVKVPLAYVSYKPKVDGEDASGGEKTVFG